MKGINQKGIIPKAIKQRGISAAVIAALVLTPFAGTAKAQTNAPVRAAGAKAETEKSKLKLWYDKPAPITSSDSRWWQSVTLPIGNGSIGGLVFGAVSKDRLHINEKTLWNGGPKGNTGNDQMNGGNPYNGGNRLSYAGEEVRNNFLKQLDSTEKTWGMDISAANKTLMDNFSSGRANKGSYLDFGDIYLDFSAGKMTDQNVTNYVRELDMETGVSTVSYDYGGVTYKREYYVSHPDQVMVVRLSASKPKSLTFKARLEGNMPGTKNYSISGHKITMSGSLSNNGMRYEAQLAAKAQDGTVVDQTSNHQIEVTNATEVILVLGAGTDYVNDFPTYRGEEPKAEVTKQVDAALKKTGDELLARHKEDYQELFGRVTFDLGGKASQIPTDQLVENYRNGKYDVTLEELIFQFGRYLTITGSREDTLPTNLCGLWLLGDASGLWQGDYHFNVNLQMNYWPAYVTNLAECGQSMVNYIESLVEPGRISAQMSIGAVTEKPSIEDTPIGEGKGFMVHTANNPFGCTASFGSQEFGWNPNGGTWALQNVYEAYQFTGNVDLLEKQIFPLLKEVANMWTDRLYYSQTQKRWVVGPSVSAEQGPTTLGTTYDQSLVWQCFEDAAEAGNILLEKGRITGARAEELRNQIKLWKEKQEGLKPVMIGEEGQIKEWFQETSIGKAKAGTLPEESIWNFNAGYTYEQHRHSSHLMGLYPGTLIKKDKENWMEAAMYSLERRDFAGTGWSKAHRLNLWARTGNGNNAYRLVQGMLKGGNAGILTNLLDSHGNGNGNHTDFPVFQIDGNFGLTAGMAEMMLQSQEDVIELLPALPDVWTQGNIKGLVARGNFVVDMEFQDSQMKHVQVKSPMGGTCKMKYKGIGTVKVTDEKQQVIPVSVKGSDEISFETVKGSSYQIAGFSTPPKAPAKITVDRRKNGIVTLQWEPVEGSVYNLYKKTKEGYTLLAKNIEVPGYVDEGNDNTEELFYKVSTVKNGVESNLSEQIKAPVAIDQDPFLNKTGFTAEAGSEQEGETAQNVLDGKTDTLWHTSWSGAKRDLHYLIVDMKKPYYVSGFEMVPRTSQKNGIITEYQLLGSLDGKDYVEISNGTFAGDNRPKEAAFAAAKARYLKLVSKKSISGDAKEYSSMAEWNIRGREEENVGEAVNTKALEVRIMMAETKKAESYKKENYADFVKVLEQGKKIWKDSNSTQEQVDAVYKELSEKLAWLEQFRVSSETIKDTESGTRIPETEKREPVTNPIIGEQKVQLLENSFAMQIKQKTKSVQLVILPDHCTVVSWKCSKPALLQVTGKANGSCVLKAKKAGKAVIEVLLSNGETKKITVKVQKGKIKTKAIRNIKKTLTLKKKKTQKLVPVLKPFTSQDKITFHTSDKNTVSVNKKGVLKAKKAGNAKITVRAGKKKVVCRVKVK